MKFYILYLCLLAILVFATASPVNECSDNGKPCSEAQTKFLEKLAKSLTSGKQKKSN